MATFAIMPFRFFRRVKIAPGLTLNLSKGGLSLSGGIPGAQMTVGTSGVRKTLGLPGTGLHWTKQSGWGQQRQVENRVRINLKEVETEELAAALNGQGPTLANPSTNRKYTEGQIAREIQRRESEEKMAALTVEAATWEENYRAVLDHWKELPRIPTMAEFEQYSERAQFKPLPPPEDPNYEDARRNLHKELTEELYASFPYTMLPVSVSKNKAKAKLTERWPEQVSKIQKAYEERMAAYRERMAQVKGQHDAIEDTRLGSLIKILENDPQATTDLACDVFENIDWPFETAAGIASNDGVHLYVNLDLPEIEDVIPAIAPRISRSKELVESKRSKEDQNEDYFHLVVGQAVYLAACQFAWNPTLQSISIAAFTQRTTKSNSETTDQYIYCATFTQEQIRNYNPRSQSLASFLAQCGVHINRVRLGAMRQIDPPDWITT